MEQEATPHDQAPGDHPHPVAPHTTLLTARTRLVHTAESPCAPPDGRALLRRCQDDLSALDFKLIRREAAVVLEALEQVDLRLLSRGDHGRRRSWCVPRASW